MGLEIVMIVVLPALDEVYKLLAVAVALFFPAAMLTLIAIDKLHKTSDENPMAPRHYASGVHEHLAFSRSPRRNP
jgi:hypothetical protein